MRFHLKKNGKEFFNYSCLFRPTLIKSSDFVSGTSTEKFNWFVNEREGLYWSNINAQGTFTLVKPIVKAKDAAISAVEFGEMTNGYDYLENLEMQMDFKKHIGVSINYTTTEAITADAQEIRVNVNYTSDAQTFTRPVKISTW